MTRRTCLIVDDSDVVRQVARRIIENLGFLCIEASDGDEALELCQGSMPDAILLDWIMPTMTGIEFLDQLRKKAGNADVPPKIIFCTSEIESKKIHQALKAGAHEYIMKPFDHKAIASKFMQVGLIEG